jgi:hypothetical protein
MAMKITKKILENIIKEEIEKLIAERDRDMGLEPMASFTREDPQAETDDALRRMRGKRQKYADEDEMEKLNPIKKSHRVAGDAGGPTIERAHITQAIKSVKSALYAAKKSSRGEEYSNSLVDILNALNNIEAATRQKSPEQMGDRAYDSGAWGDTENQPGWKKKSPRGLQEIIKEEIEAVLAEQEQIMEGALDGMSEDDMRRLGASWLYNAHFEHCANKDEKSEGCQRLLKVYRNLNPTGSL